MQILRVNNITVNFAGRELYRDLSWAVGERERVALIGPNGAGKSTLFKVLLGDIEPDRGHVARQRGLRIGHLPQDIDLPAGMTLIETAMIKPRELAEVEAALNFIESQLADPDVYSDDARLAQTLEQHEAQLALYERMNGARHESHVRELLAMLALRKRTTIYPRQRFPAARKNWWRWRSWRCRRRTSCCWTSRTTISI